MALSRIIWQSHTSYEITFLGKSAPQIQKLTDHETIGGLAHVHIDTQTDGDDCRKQENKTEKVNPPSANKSLQANKQQCHANHNAEQNLKKKKENISYEKTWQNPQK